ncbi:MAG TPA: L,D-transpeptidase family protein [Caulobacteraceae bacterium]|nr:L,D-transpeptidase family protein [Caulobacteraceae bacterium]
MSQVSFPASALRPLPIDDPIRSLTRRRSLGLAGAALFTASCAPRTSNAQPNAELGANLSDPLARRFYEQRGWRPAWTPAQARALGQSFAVARQHGLNPALFAPKFQGDGQDAQETALTIAALGYAKALATGLIEPQKVEKDFTLERHQPDLVSGLNKTLSEGGDLGAWLASLPPSDAEYQALSQAYVAALSQAGLPTAPAQGAPVGTSAAPSDQARQLAANLERRRWLNRTPAARRIDVNSAATFLVYLRPSAQPWAARVVTGSDEHQTPCIQGGFQRLIANPPWRVPEKIAAKEILPKGAGYMARQHMHVVNGLVEQEPGPHNSLGLVKFDVDDPYDIYLHDTPAKQLFKLPERHRSHGCVRVQNALDLARLIAGEAGKADEFEQALASKDTKPVEIGDPIPVRILYHTVYLGADSQLAFVPDVYGTDDALAVALGLGQVPARAARGQPPVLDLGP